MKEFPTKQDDIGNQYPAEDYNSSMDELNNVVTSTSQTLDLIKTDQLGAAMAAYGAAGSYYVDSGSANNYLLAPADSRVALKNYPIGATIRFIPANTNTGASNLTVTGLTSKSIRTPQGALMQAGEIISGVLTSVIYDGTYFISYNTESTFITGDVISSINTTRPGFLKMNDTTFGSAASTGGAGHVASDSTETLFKLLWEKTSDTWCPVITGRSTADADWTANKSITLPRSLGRALACAGHGSGLTSRALGEYLGQEEHQLTIPEMPAHAHPGSTVTFPYGGDGTPYVEEGSSSRGTFSATTVTIASQGGDSAHNNMQPSFFLNFFIKL